MKTYSVKQIAEMLNTNPETVRRWIRNNKLKAVQVSRKDGNIVTEDDLTRFLKSTPKYSSKMALGLGLAEMFPIPSIGVLATGIVAGALLSYFEGKDNFDLRVRPEDFKEYLQTSITKLQDTVQQKRELIKQTENEITEISKQINQYEYLLNHEDLLEESLEKAIEKMEE